jgi:uncharacterized membrane protein YkvA (DUF1232 family)
MVAAARVARDTARPGSPGLGARITAIPRMVGATLSGRYPYLSKSRLAMLAVGAGYVVSPVDLMPEALLLALGTVDDIGVAMVVAASLLGEAGRFLEWEHANLQAVASPVVDGTVVR